MPTIKAKPLPHISQEFADYIWANIAVGSEDECWPWKKTLFASGYGRTYMKGKAKRVSRIVFKMFYGADPYPCNLLHRCDNPPCCNPHHFFLGWDSDNVSDCAEKGRRVPPAFGNSFGVGERNGRAKTTWDIVDRVRALFEKGLPHKDLAAYFKLSDSQVQHIISGRTWNRGKLTSHIDV